jgi:hypothetical protein
MRCLVLQDWTTVSSSVGTATPISQSPDAWFDAGGFQDIVAWFQCTHAITSSGGLNLGLASSPTRESDYLFQGFALVDPTNIGVQVSVVLNKSPNPPIARWIKWFVGPTYTSATWEVTFRIFLAVNSPGGN